MTTEVDHKARVEARLKRERAERGSAQSEREFKEELALWDRIKDSKNPDDFYDFLLERPSGYLAEHAQFRLDQLEAAKVQVQPGADGIKQLPSGVNRFEVGDEYEFESIDLYTRLSTRGIGRVTYADSDRVEINGGSTVFTQMGASVKNRFGTYNPPIIVTPSDLAVGKRWRSAYTTTRPDGVVENSFLNCHVTALEEVKVIAGTFKAYKVEREGLASFPGGRTILKTEYWIDPATMVQVRHDRDFKDSAGRRSEYSSVQLVRMTLVPRARPTGDTK